MEKETPIWIPSEYIDGPKIDSFLKQISKDNNFNLENSLSVLYESGYDVDKAIDSIKSCECSANSSEWSKQDKLLFEQGIWYYGKNFLRINQLVSQTNKNKKEKKG